MDSRETYKKFSNYYDAYVGEFNDDIGLYLGYSQPGLKILEIGCGTGRILKYLTNIGASITGVDISDEMLAIAKSKLAKQVDAGVLRLCNHNFSQYTMEDTFDRVFITFYTFNYFIDDLNRKTFLKNLYNCMNPGSILIVDLFCPSILIHPENQEKWTEKSFTMDGRKIVFKDKRTMHGNIEERVQVFKDMGCTHCLTCIPFKEGMPNLEIGKQSDDIITRRLFFTKHEMVDMLSGHGFKNILLTDGYRYDLFHELDENETTKTSFVILAVKR